MTAKLSLRDQITALERRLELADQREAALESEIGALNRANAELTEQLKNRQRAPQEQPFD